MWERIRKILLGGKEERERERGCNMRENNTQTKIN